MDITFTSAMTVEPIVSCGGDWLICDAARVSSIHEKGAGPRDLTVRDTKLITRLIQGRHGGPFRHGSQTLFVEAPIFVFREWRTHKIVMYQDEEEFTTRTSLADDAGYSEASARYRPLTPTFWIPRPDRPMIVPENHKAMTPVYEIADPHNYDCVIERMKRAYRATWREYQKMITTDLVAPEVARSVLGTGIYSAMYVSCNPNSLMHFLSLRVYDEHARFRSYPQPEIQEAALQAEALFKAGWPVTYEAFVAHGRVSP